MREIKFRAFYKGKMIDWENILECMNMILGYAKDTFGRDPDVRLMQYTGLTDKNGKEIYESDIVAIFDRNDNNYDRKNNTYYAERPVREIKWNPDGGFTLEYSYGDFELTLLGWAMDHHELELEIIGNIHQNPDLLTP